MSAAKIIGIAVKTATIRELAHERESPTSRDQFPLYHKTCKDVLVRFFALD